VDVRHIAHAALSESELLERVPPQLRPPGPQETVTREELVAALREELSELKDEISNLRADETRGPQKLPSHEKAITGGSASQATKERSLAYWMRLNEIALGEATLQADAASAFDPDKAAKVFAVKGRIVRFAAKAVTAIPDEQVEPMLLQFGLQLSTWYENGGELYDRAVQIWESAANSEGREQLNEDWQRAERHHQNEARLLRDKAAAVRNAMSRRFGEQFTPFGEPQQ
jgi:hypothetical protein